MTRLPLKVLIVADTALAGGMQTVNNVREMVEWIALSSPHIGSVTMCLVHFEDIVDNIDFLLRQLLLLTVKPCYLLLYFNGHSKLWKGEEAMQQAQEFGAPTLFARDGSTERISALMYNQTPVISPSQMKTILDSIPDTVQRTLFFIDTCHSMSLVSVLLVPPIDIRIIHSSADDEKTWQSEQQGSFMSSAWNHCSTQLPWKSLRHSQMPLWEAMQTVAHTIQSQLLTSGPGQGFSFF